MWALFRLEGMPPDVTKTEVERGNDLNHLYETRDRWNQVALARYGSFEKRRYSVMPIDKAAVAVGAAR